MHGGQELALVARILKGLDDMCDNSNVDKNAPAHPGARMLRMHVSGRGKMVLEFHDQAGLSTLYLNKQRKTKRLWKKK